MEYRMTKAEAIGVLGAELVEEVECQSLNIVQDHSENADLLRWESPAISLVGKGIVYDGEELEYVKAVFYTDEEDQRVVTEFGGDWGSIDWNVNHFLIG